ncbi:unnamed protein product, partial [marine sediment metagenome]
MYDTLLDRELEEDSSTSAAATELQAKIGNQDEVREDLPLDLNSEKEALETELAADLD